MKKKAENLVSIIFGCFVLFLGVKSCTKTTIPPIEKIEKYSSNMPNGEVDIIYLCPNNTLVLSKRNYNLEDLGIYNIQRRSIIHYFGGLFNTDADGTPLGIRYYSKIDYAWNVHLKFKYNIGTVPQSTFSNVGAHDEIFKFSNNSSILEINDSRYIKQEISNQENDKIALLTNNLK